MLILKPLQLDDLKHLWKIGFTEENPEWKKWDAPYFEEPLPLSLENFLANYQEFFQSEDVLGIFVNEQAIGFVTRYWECEKTRWLEIGIAIYNPNYWSGGYGTTALKQWISLIFDQFKELEHIGLTTWSGNIRMMRASEKLGMKQEACIRRVRYWQGTYYDSVKYGVLREEWSK